MNNREIVQNTDVPFDEIFVPSKGIFYKNKKDSFLVKYLTAKEENVLTSPSLVDSGRAVDLVLSSCILDWEGDTKDMLVGDKDAFFIYLRSTAYGDKVTFNYTCPNCKKESDSQVILSQLEMKEYEKMPNELGEFEYTLPSMRIKLGKEDEPKEVCIKFKPRTIGNELEIKKIIEEETKIIGGVEVDNSIEARYRVQITSINQIDDKEFIQAIIKRMPISDSLSLRTYMDDREPGINNLVSSVCSNCEFVSDNAIPIGYNFFGLTDEYKRNMMDEIFLISYYSKGGHRRGDLYQMPVFERRWVMERISEEVEKRNKAEKAAESRAKSQARSKGGRGV